MELVLMSSFSINQLLIAGLLVGSALLMAFAGWRMSTPSISPAITGSQASAPVSFTFPNDHQLSADISQLAPFGQVQRTVPKPAPVVAKIPEPVKKVLPRLNLRINGLIANSQERAVALLEVSGKTGSFSVGDDLGIKEPATLLEVRSDGIAVERKDGSEEFYPLEPRQDIAGLIRTENSALRVVDLKHPDTLPLVQQFRQHIASRRDALAQYIEVRRDVSGHYWLPASDHRFLSLLPLQSDDLIVSVNQLQLASTDQDRLVQELISKSQLDIEVRRDGEPLSFQILY